MVEKSETNSTLRIGDIISYVRSKNGILLTIDEAIEIKSIVKDEPVNQGLYDRLEWIALEMRFIL